ncbi:helix-turn-helix transcriptional regulator [Candidatus Roizmanbacteria bacterium]|nr:helix-turn-helix transcriptional regulator [Candidatus Roizmanbacteria bacterium]
MDSIPSVTRQYVNRQVGFAATVAEKLKASGMTQRDLADRLGKKESYISRVLSGDANPTLKTISEFEVALGEDVITFNLQKNRSQAIPVTKYNEIFRVDLTGGDRSAFISPGEMTFFPSVSHTFDSTGKDWPSAA